jgi:hypothetical protein
MQIYAVRVEEWFKENLTYSEPGPVFFAPADTPFPDEIAENIHILALTGILAQVKIRDGGAFYQFLDEPYEATVTKTSIRLPKMEFLLTLTPEDFSAFVDVISTARLVTGSLMGLDKGIAGYKDIQHFFVIEKTNFRISPEYASSAWITWETIKYLYNLKAEYTLNLKDYEDEEEFAQDQSRLWQRYQLIYCHYLAAAQTNFIRPIPMDTQLDLNFNDAKEAANPRYVKLYH